MTTLDYYRFRLRRKKPALVEIDLGETGIGLDDRGRSGDGVVAVVLGNGRRVEIGWTDLSRVAGQSQPLGALIRCLEGA